MLLAQILLLAMCANGAPILARLVFNSPQLSLAVDAGKLFFDKRPILGPSKTWRGLFASLLLCTIGAPILGLNLTDGLMIATLAMLGDLLSSFIKRRLNLNSSDMALGIDQVPESLLPFLYAHYQYQLPLPQVAIGVVLFFVLELLLSRLLFHLGIRRRPY